MCHCWLCSVFFSPPVILRRLGRHHEADRGWASCATRNHPRKKRARFYTSKGCPGVRLHSEGRSWALWDALVPTGCFVPPWEMWESQRGIASAHGPHFPGRSVPGLWRHTTEPCFHFIFFISDPPYLDARGGLLAATAKLLATVMSKGIAFCHPPPDGVWCGRYLTMNPQGSVSRVQKWPTGQAVPPPFSKNTASPSASALLRQLS